MCTRNSCRLSRYVSAMRSVDREAEGRPVTGPRCARDSVAESGVRRRERDPMPREKKVQEFRRYARAWP